jgi:hypothetical protein
MMSIRVDYLVGIILVVLAYWLGTIAGTDKENERMMRGFRIVQRYAWNPAVNVLERYCFGGLGEKDLHRKYEREYEHE